MASNDYRNESRRRPPLERYGTPGTQYPTANPYDIVISEEVTNRAQAFEPVLFGTPHPTVAAALLCFQGQVKQGNTDKAPIRIYANPRLAQEPYNLVNGDDEANSGPHPVFVRSYLLPRGYTKGTMATPLTALIGLTLVSGGTGYAAGNEQPGYGKIALGFSGGGGSGAAGYAECVAGVIVTVALTSTGTGYTSAPTVSVSGGSGASITALLQPATALLSNEVEQPAEDPFGGWFVRVTRTWTTIPGPSIATTGIDADGNTITTTKTLKPTGSITSGETYSSGVLTTTTKGEGDANFAEEIVETVSLPGNEMIDSGFESITGARTRTCRQLVLNNTPSTINTALIARAASRVFNSITMYCTDCRIVAKSDLTGELVTEYMEEPPTRTVQNSGTFPIPAVFTYLTGWDVPVTPGFVTGGPFLGVNFELTAKRTAVHEEEEISYSVGDSGVALPDLYTVVTPAAGSRVFPIPGNCIHNAYDIVEITGAGTQHIEIVDASTPSSYTKGDSLITRASEEPWGKATIFNEKRITTSTEPT